MNITIFIALIKKLFKELGIFFSIYYNDKIESFKSISGLGNDINAHKNCITIYLILSILVIYITSISLLTLSIATSLLYIIQLINSGFKNNSDITKEAHFIKTGDLITIGGFSFDIFMFVSFILCLLYIMAYIFLMYQTTNNIFIEWYYINIFIVSSIIIILLYFISFYSTFIEIIKSSSKLTNTIYSNININFLHDELCNYNDRGTYMELFKASDDKFVEGKCNKTVLADLLDTQIKTKINDYCEKEFLKIYNSNTAEIANITKKDFQSIIDQKKKISYYDNILSAHITGCLYTWYYTKFIKGNKDVYNFFSLSNIFNETNYISAYFTNKTNPFLEISREDIKKYIAFTYEIAEVTAISPPSDLTDNGKKIKMRQKLYNYLIIDYEKKLYSIYGLIINHVLLCDSVIPPVYSFILIIIVAIILFIIKFSNFISQ